MKMDQFLDYLSPVDIAYEEMIATLEDWANINSHSLNEEGLSSMLSILRTAFSPLEGTLKTDKQSLSIVKRPEKEMKILLGGHYDTVYPVDSPFQSTLRTEEEIMVGPGVTDMKGGLLVMLKALEVFEKTPFAENIGWEVFINPDEEIGSPYTLQLLEECAKRNSLGLLFEPASPSGNMVSSRKGSSNYTVAVKGRPAHSGRDFNQGKSAIYAIADLISKVEPLSHGETTVNVGRVAGGIANNIVAEASSCALNVRYSKPEELTHFESQLETIVAEVSKREGIEISTIPGTQRPPKLITRDIESLFSDIKSCANVLGISLEWYPTGGVCDGNVLANAGLPTIDTMGVVGGKIHTPEEYIYLPSLKQRTKLAALLLMKLAAS